MMAARNLRPATIRMAALPTFLVIGAMKAGTYSLHHHLGLHPQIEMSAKRKEVNYFVEELNWPRGSHWYAQHWTGDTAQRGESSTRYTMRDRWRGVPARIAATLPDVKLVYLVRDPIRRLISQYVHEVDDNQEARDFETMLGAADRDLALNTGRYHYQLQAYLDHLPRERIHVLAFEDLIADPVATLQPLLAFLGVDAGFSDPRWQEAHNDSDDKRRETTLGRVLVRPLVGRRPLRRNRFLRESFTREIPRPVFDPQRHADIVAMYRDDQRQLEAFCGRRFDRWSLLNP